MNSVGSDEERVLLPERQTQKSYKFQLEFSLFLMLFSYNVTANILPNQLLKATCLYDGFDMQNCSNLNSHNVSKEIEDVIQPQVAEITMVTNLMHSIFPAFICMLLGPWSDKFGRRPALIGVFVGYALSLIGFSIVSTFADFQPVINPWIYVLPHVSSILTGGYGALMLLSFCYVADTSNESTRSSRLTIIEMIMFFGFIFGKLSSSFLVNRAGASVIFHIASAGGTISTIFIIIFLHESIEKATEQSCESAARELLSLRPALEMIKTCFKRRENSNDKSILWCAMFVIVLSVFTYHGSFNVFYLFLREKFHWNLQDTAVFQTYTSILTTLGCIIGIAFKRIANISDVLVISLSAVSSLVERFIQAFANEPRTMYISVIVGTFSTLTGPMCRSVVASLVPHSEIGKVYSFISVLESSSTLIASPLYTVIYDKTFKTFAGAFLLLTSSVYFIIVVISAFIYRMMRQRDTRAMNSDGIASRIEHNE